MATICCCTKQKNMQKVRGIYQGFFALSFMFFIAATFICISLLGLCTEDWLPRNLVIASIAEVIIFIWGIVFLKKGASEVLEESHSVKLVKDLYVRISYLMGFGISYAIIILTFHHPNPIDNSLNPILIYSLNIIVPALFFLVWALIVISRINKIMRF